MRTKFFISISITLISTTLWGREIPAVIFNISADSSEYVLLVDKKQQTLYVAKSNAPQEVNLVKEFRVTTGKVAGDKEREGDRRTPEGIYYIEGIIPGNKLTKKYGPAAYILDYPNFVDRLQGRNGSNIWIHGRDEAIRDRITEGCISLDNNKLLTLGSYLKIKQTPVIIYDNLDGYWVTDKQDYQKNWSTWQDYLNGWVQAWQQGALDQYIDYYAPAFRDEGGRSKPQFRAYKSSLEARYVWKRVNLEKILLLTSRQETHVRFIQKYQSPYFYSEGWKKLILIPTESGWKIISEIFSPTRRRLSTEEFIENFLQKWEKAWEAKDIESYCACYAPSFRSDGMDFQTWRKYKNEIFASLGQINIERSNLKVQSPQALTYTVTFRQIYQADGYRDVGLKTLVIQGTPDSLRIVREEWKKLE